MFVHSACWPQYFLHSHYCAQYLLRFHLVGLRGIEPRLQDPQPRVLPLYDSPRLFSGNEFLKVIRIFLRSLYAFRARLESLFAYRNPLQVWMLFLFYSRIVVSTEKNPFDSKTADFFANFANHFTATPIRECTLMTRINY